jgi:hypothetical protein
MKIVAREKYRRATHRATLKTSGSFCAKDGKDSGYPITGVDLAGTVGWVQMELGEGEVHARNCAGL